jgi:hypothetical protein
MTRRFAKYALYLLVFAALLDAGLHRKRKSTSVRSQHEALMTWEDEGGGLPT